MAGNESIDNSPIKRVVLTDAAGVPQYSSGSVGQAVDVTNLPDTVDTNSGNKGASTLRAVIATDQPNLTTALNVDVTKINSVTPLMGAGNTGTGSPRVTIATDQAQLTNPLKVEEQFSYARKTADGQVKAAAGFLHSVIVTPTAATATAGVITIYDSTAESGTVILTINIATDNHTNYIFPLDVICGTGIYVAYDDTVTNHAVTVAYR